MTLFVYRHNHYEIQSKKTIPRQWVKWENAKEVVCCCKIGNKEKIFFVYSECLISGGHTFSSSLRVINMSVFEISCDADGF